MFASLGIQKYIEVFVFQKYGKLCFCGSDSIIYSFSKTNFEILGVVL
jgi:hypothetical protein